MPLFFGNYYPTFNFMETLVLVERFGNFILSLFFWKLLFCCQLFLNIFWPCCYTSCFTFFKAIFPLLFFSHSKLCPISVPEIKLFFLHVFWNQNFGPISFRNSINTKIRQKLLWDIFCDTLCVKVC